MEKGEPPGSPWQGAWPRGRESRPGLAALSLLGGGHSVLVFSENHWAGAAGSGAQPCLQMPSCRDKGGICPSFLLVAQGLVVRAVLFGVWWLLWRRRLAVGPEDVLSSGCSDRCPFSTLIFRGPGLATGGSQAVAPPPHWPYRASWGSGDASRPFQSPHQGSGPASLGLTPVACALGDAGGQRAVPQAGTKPAQGSATGCKLPWTH